MRAYVNVQVGVCVCVHNTACFTDARVSQSRPPPPTRLPPVTYKRDLFCLETRCVKTVVSISRDATVGQLRNS